MLVSGRRVSLFFLGGGGWELEGGKLRDVGDAKVELKKQNKTNKESFWKEPQKAPKVLLTTFVR